VNRNEKQTDHNVPYCCGLARASDLSARFLEATMTQLSDEERLDALHRSGYYRADEFEKLLTSRERWRRVALLCVTLLAAFVIMFVAQCAKLP
jgi:hypothetical protein